MSVLNIVFHKLHKFSVWLRARMGLHTPYWSGWRPMGESRNAQQGVVSVTGGYLQQPVVECYASGQARHGENPPQIQRKKCNHRNEFLVNRRKPCAGHVGELHKTISRCRKRSHMNMKRGKETYSVVRKTCFYLSVRFSPNYTPPWQQHFQADCFDSDHEQGSWCVMRS